MLNRILLFALLFVSLCGYSQSYINKNAGKVYQKFLKLKGNTPDDKVRITRNDSLIIYSETSEHALELTVRFDSAGLCKSETYSSNCQQCIERKKNATLKKHRYRWKKINGNQYVSKYKARLLLEVEPNAVNSTFKIIRTSWTKQLYDLIFSKPE